MNVSAIAVEVGKPNHTLYIQNLNEKAKPSEVKRMLSSMMSKYGTILDIVVKRRLRLRGQAFVVFDNEGSAVRALHFCQGNYLYEKPMIVKFARNKSDWISKRDGTFEQERKKRLETKMGEKVHRNLETPEGIPHIAVGSEFIVANEILFVENLHATKEACEQVFQRIYGFMEVRTIPGRSDIAFVEYEDIAQSTVAKNELDGYLLNGSVLKVSFAKK